MIVQCPHCQDWIFIEAVNCAIFRHAVYKSTLEYIPPHAPKEECDRLIQEGLVYGCAKPFRLEYLENRLVPVICDYI
jgi:hypothetical protein